jgi:hypothetical protein
MNHEELQKLRERLIEASQQRPRSRVQHVIDRLVARIDGMLRKSERRAVSGDSKSDETNTAA